MLPFFLSNINKNLLLKKLNMSKMAYMKKPLNILVIDDEEHVLDIINTVISEVRPDDKVFSSMSVKEAFEILRNPENKIDVLISDIRMQEMNGALFAQTVYELGINVRIILATGYLNFIDQLELLGLGVERILQKPFKINELIDAIENPRPVQSTNIKKMVPVKVEGLLKLKKFPYDVYIHLGGDKIIKMFSSEDSIDSVRIEQLLTNNVTTLYSRKLESLNFNTRIYSPVRVSNFKIGKNIDFDVYYLEDEKYKKILIKNTIINDEIIGNLKSRALKVLFIEDLDEPKFIDYLESHLGEVIKNASVKLEEKAEATVNLVNSRLGSMHRETSDENFKKLTVSQKMLQDFINCDKRGITYLLKINQDNKALETHSTRVASLAYAILNEITELRADKELKNQVRALDEYMFENDDVKEIIFTGGLLHDIGKPFLLDKEEDDFQHAKEAFKRLKNIKSIHPKALEIIEQHEELCDGSGGPKKLTKPHISFFAQVISLANFYDLLIHEKNCSKEHALLEIQTNLAKFNKHLVPILERVLAA